MEGAKNLFDAELGRKPREHVCIDFAIINNGLLGTVNNNFDETHLRIFLRTIREHHFKQMLLQQIKFTFSPIKMYPCHEEGMTSACFCHRKYIY